MGGYGSGRNGGRPTTDNGLTLTLSKLLRDRLFRPGSTWGSLVWTNTTTGERVGSISYEAHLGALLLGYYGDDGKLVYAGRVGTGMSEKVLKVLRRRVDPLARSKSPSTAACPQTPKGRKLAAEKKGGLSPACKNSEPPMTHECDADHSATCQYEPSTPLCGLISAERVLLTTGHTDNAGAYTVAITELSANATVPEPLTWTLMLLGFAGLAFASSRNRKRMFQPI